MALRDSGKVAVTLRVMKLHHAERDGYFAFATIVPESRKSI
jgi:hypothetical protein